MQRGGGEPERPPGIYFSMARNKGQVCRLRAMKLTVTLFSLRLQPGYACSSHNPQT